MNLAHSCKFQSQQIARGKLLPLIGSAGKLDYGMDWSSGGPSAEEGSLSKYGPRQKGEYSLPSDEPCYYANPLAP